MDDQGNQKRLHEVSDEMDIDEISENITEKILSVRTEASVLQEASEKIENLSKEKVSILEGAEILHNTKSNNIVTDDSQRVELAKQVQNGEITPFEAVAQQSNLQKVKGTFDKTSHLLDLEKYIRQQAELGKQRKQLKKTVKTLHNDNDSVAASKKLKLSNTFSKSCKTVNNEKHRNKRKKSILNVQDKRLLNNKDSDISIQEEFQSHQDGIENRNRSCRNASINLDTLKDNTSDYVEQTRTDFEITSCTNDSGSEYVPSDDQDSEDEAGGPSKKRKTFIKSTGLRTKRILDDGDEDMYRERVRATGYKGKEAVHKVDNLFKVPLSIWKKLYRYQRVSIQWLWELHGRDLGGLLGDEMGLGKTVQVIAFLAGLDCSELLSDGGRFRGLGPTIIICPATLMEQWVKHFHEWWPKLRIVVLHQSGTYNGDLEYLLHSLKCGGILITSYSGVLRHKDLLVSAQWHYVILDEGHKIRNPQAKVSKAVKEFSTPHRLLLTGSPMQNSLKELWSLFDFILPGKLGTLPAFLEHCASPITRGGYANATPLQEATALQVATMLRDAIMPYMLRRTKADVKHHVSLPEKNEQVLFCSLTDEQKKLYKQYLRSEDVSYVLHERNNRSESGRYRARLLIALSALRKICNHPDLFLYTREIDSDEDITMSDESLDKFGYWKRAGKMTVVRSLLKIWKKQGHRVLLFTQGRQMMHILESLLQSEQYTYLRMDGTTPMSQRQQTICTFNDTSKYFVFLLTTRVGGLGVNLTGANRVVIYDPDWNPATDAQARERAWRIGQNKRVTIYRLITAGTIEEKIYHRQIFKLLLSNKVLEDPRQRRLFKTSDLAELFNLNEPIDGEASESDRLFRESKLTPKATKFSSSKIEKMRKLAATLSKNMNKSTSNSVPVPQTTSDTKETCAVNDSSDVPNKTDKQNSHDESQPLDGNENMVFPTPQTNVNGTDTLIGDNVLSQEEIPKNETDKISETNGKCMDTNTDTILSKNNVTNDMSSELSHSIESTEHGSAIAGAEKDPESEACKVHQKQKRNKKSSRCEKKSISAIFEGERISCLLGRRLGNCQTNEPSPTEDDHYVLKKLFAKSTVRSAFQHEAVLSNTGCDSEDGNPMHRLARETAQESMECVRKSRKWCWKPTWDSMSPKNE